MGDLRVGSNDLPGCGLGILRPKVLAAQIDARGVQAVVVDQRPRLHTPHLLAKPICCPICAEWFIPVGNELVDVEAEPVEIVRQAASRLRNVPAATQGACHHVPRPLDLQGLECAGTVRGKPELNLLGGRPQVEGYGQCRQAIGVED